jgi:histidyl-tRNA synthetase
VAQTQPFTVLIDPNVAADGVTVADLKEQFEHNLRMRQLITDVNQVAARLREAQVKVRADSGGDAKASQLEAIAAKLFTEPVRYGKPGLQAHITYLAGMTNGADQKIGRDAIERYATLRQELDAIRAELDRVLNP